MIYGLVQIDYVYVFLKDPLRVVVVLSIYLDPKVGVGVDRKPDQTDGINMFDIVHPVQANGRNHV